MARIIWTRPAVVDVAEIRAYIGRDSPRYARLEVERILGAVERLADFPRSGRIVPELRQQALRELIVGRYRVVYRLREDDAHILAVVHGARQFPTEEFGTR